MRTGWPERPAVRLITRSYCMGREHRHCKLLYRVPPILAMERVTPRCPATRPSLRDRRAACTGSRNQPPSTIARAKWPPRRAAPPAPPSSSAAVQTPTVSGGAFWPSRGKLSRHLKYMARARKPAEAGLRCPICSAAESSAAARKRQLNSWVSPKIGFAFCDESIFWPAAHATLHAWPPCSIAAPPQARTCRSGSRTTCLTIACTSRCGVPLAPESISSTEQAEPSCRPGPDCPTKKARG